MPITSAIGEKNLTLGRGKLFFDRFTPAQVAAGITAATRGEGEFYIGNTPALSMTSESEDLDHFDSDGGVRVKDDSVQLQLDRTGSFTTDNITVGNLALLFLSSGATKVTQVSATAATFLITAAKHGAFYQIGATESLPTGVRGISNVVVNKGVGFTTPVTGAGNWEIDEVTGRIFIVPKAGSTDIVDGVTDIQVTFDLAAGTRDQVISGATAIYGAMRFIADNPKGRNRDYYFPYVKLQPEGDFNLKGDEWQAMTFAFEALQKASNIASLYVDGRLVASV